MTDIRDMITKNVTVGALKKYRSGFVQREDTNGRIRKVRSSKPSVTMSPEVEQLRLVKAHRMMIEHLRTVSPAAAREYLKSVMGKGAPEQQIEKQQPTTVEKKKLIVPPGQENEDNNKGIVTGQPKVACNTELSNMIQNTKVV